MDEGEKEKKQQAMIAFSEILEELEAERIRQIEKWGMGQQLTPIEYCAILGEEFGEVCRAVHDAHFATQYPNAIQATPGDYSQYRKELVQLATVCVAAIQNLDNNNNAI